jgi:hypothetical protein
LKTGLDPDPDPHENEK